MRVKYFPETDTALVEFNENEVHETREVNENIYIDLDKDGNLVTLTIEHAKIISGLKEFSYQDMTDKSAWACS